MVLAAPTLIPVAIGVTVVFLALAALFPVA
jgi:hypothetical protein